MPIEEFEILVEDASAEANDPSFKVGIPDIQPLSRHVADHERFEYRHIFHCKEQSCFGLVIWANS